MNEFAKAIYIEGPWHGVVIMGAKDKTEDVARIGDVEHVYERAETLFKGGATQHPMDVFVMRLKEVRDVE